MVISFILLYLLANILIGWWASRRVRNVGDFVLAGRRLPLPLAAAAMFATWFGSETVLGASSEFVEHGLIGVIEDPFGAALCLLLVGLFYARRLYRMNILTFSDYFGLRFSKKVEFLSAIFLVPSYFGWIAAQLVAMGIVLELVTGLPMEWGVLLCTLVVVAYTYFGGMWAISITDFVQTIVIIAGLGVVGWTLLQDAGGWDVVVAKQPEGFFRFIPEAGWEHGLEYFAAWITIGLGSIPQQDVFQRLMSAKSERVAVWSSFTGAGLYLVVALLPLLIAMAGKVSHPELLGEDAQGFLPSVMMRHAGPLLQVLFFGALLSAILSTASGAILASAAVLGENILKPRLPHLPEKNFLALMRLSVVGVALVSAGMAMMQRNIFELVSQSSALSLVSLFVPLTAGLFWPKASTWGALASMLLGMAVWLPFEIWGGFGPAIVWGFLGSILGMILGTWAEHSGKWKPKSA